MGPRLGYTILFVKDIRRAAEFYHSVFGFEPLEIDVSPGWAMVDAGGHTLGFSSNELVARFMHQPYRRNDSATEPAGFEIDIVVDEVADVHAAIDRAVAAGATLIGAPQIADDGATIAFLRDLDGVIIEVQTPYQSPLSREVAPT